MHARGDRRYSHGERLGAFLVSSLPGSAFAADATMSAWGAYLFFAIVATVVIVLLLHEALDDEPSEDQRRDESPVHGVGATRMSGPAPYGDSASRAVESRRTA